MPEVIVCPSWCGKGRLQCTTLACLIVAFGSVARGMNISPSSSGSSSLKSPPNKHIFPTDNGDSFSWKYLTETYSTSGDQLTGDDIRNMARSMQKCEIANSFTARTDISREETKTGKSSDCVDIINSITFGNDKEQTYHDESSFEKLSTRILYYISNPQCCSMEPNSASPISYDGVEDKAHENEIHVPPTSQKSNKAVETKKPSRSEVWGFGFLCVTIISLGALLGVVFTPFMEKKFFKHMLTFMIGLAVGSLTASAIFHLIPEALELEEHDPDRNYLQTSLVIAGGMWMFFMVEKILKFIMDYKERKRSMLKQKSMTPDIVSTVPNNNTIGVIPEKESTHGHHHHHQPTKSDSNREDGEIAPVAWLIIFGDCFHNFIDGLSIGAAFNDNIMTGVSISVAVLCEELPHELGDFAILLKSGMTVKQALFYNFLSACTCYLGMAAGIALGELDASVYIFALASGMFLYISLVDMLPEMNETAHESGKTSARKGLLTLLLQNMGMFTGVFSLYVLAIYQDGFQF